MTLTILFWTTKAAVELQRIVVTDPAGAVTHWAVVFEKNAFQYVVGGETLIQATSCRHFYI